MLLTIGIMMVLIYHSIQLPLSYDESYTFNNFTSRGLFYSIFTYPAPNNHVFHSILTNISWYLLGFTNTAFSVRAPALLFSFVSIAFVFNCCFRNNYVKSFVFTIIFLFSPNLIEYTFQARGYSIQIFFSLVSYFISNPFVARRIQFKHKLVLLLLLSTIGLYTSPAYLYTAVSIGAIFLFNFYEEIKKNKLFTCIMIVFFGLSLLLLYSPIIIYQGVDKIISNHYVTPIVGFNFFSIIIRGLKFVDYFSLPFFLGGVILLLFITISIKEKKWYNFFLFVVPFVLMAAFKQLPFLRVFLPIGILIIVFVCNAVFNHLSNLIRESARPLFKMQYDLLFLAFFCLFSVYYFNNIHKKGDLSSSFELEKAFLYLNQYDNMVFDTYDYDWYMGELILANYIVTKKPKVLFWGMKTKPNNVKSYFILTKRFDSGFKIIDSLQSFRQNKLWVEAPLQPH